MPNFEQLKTAISWSNRQLNLTRENRLKAIKEYVGMHYGVNGSHKRVPTNYIELAVTIYTQQLAARAPRVMVSTDVRELKPYAYTQELALNQMPEELKLGETIRSCVMDALFSVGVVKLGLTHSSTEVDGYDPGEIFADVVSIDDFFFDMSAKNKRDIQFMGNTYWLPFEDVEKLFKNKKIEADTHELVGAEGQTEAGEVTRGSGADMYKERIRLCDVWIPSEQTIITYAVTSGELLQTVDWDGPEEGPYHILGFEEVPDNILPLPPVSLWTDLHELGNSLFRKLGKQADRKKTVAAFQGGNDQDVENLKLAADGDGIKYSGQDPKQITVGGIDAPGLAFFLQTRDLFSWFAGNLDTLGGLSPMTDTVGQDKLLADAASARMAFMSDRVLDFSKGIFKALAWYEWTDPVRERVVVKSVPGEETLSTRVKWSAETREGDFLDYNFDIDVHSMQESTPSIKLQKLDAVMQNYILPMLPNLQQQGIDISFKAMLELVAKWSDMPELIDILMFAEQPPAGDPMQGNPIPDGSPAKPSHTTRTYERVNRPGATRAGKDDVMTRLLMSGGGGAQQSEVAALGRPNT